MVWSSWVLVFFWSYGLDLKTLADKYALKCPCPATSSFDNLLTLKHVRKDKHCLNSHCCSPKGHEFKECIAYGSGSQGKYSTPHGGKALGIFICCLISNLRLTTNSLRAIHCMPNTKLPCQRLWQSPTVITLSSQLSSKKSP